MVKKVRKNYKRLVAFLLSAAMVITNIGGNAGTVFAAEEQENPEGRESAIFMVDGQEILEAIQGLDGQEAFSKEDLEEMGLEAGRKGVVKKYEKLLMPEKGKTYELALEIDTELALEGTALQVFYNTETKEVIFLYLNESAQAVDCYVNIDGYETKLVTVEANDANAASEAGAPGTEESGEEPGGNGAGGTGGNGGSSNGGSGNGSGGEGDGSSDSGSGSAEETSGSGSGSAEETSDNGSGSAGETSDDGEGNPSGESGSGNEGSGEAAEDGSREEAPSEDPSGEKGTEEGSEKASGEESKADDPEEGSGKESEAEGDGKDKGGSGQAEDGTDGVKEDNEKAEPDKKETEGSRPEGGSADKGSPDKGEEDTDKAGNGAGTKDEGKSEEDSSGKDDAGKSDKADGDTDTKDEGNSGKEDNKASDDTTKGEGSADKPDGGNSKGEAADKSDNNDREEASGRSDDKPVREESNDKADHSSSDKDEGKSSDEGKADSDRPGSGSSDGDGGDSDGRSRGESFLSMSIHQAAIVAIPADEIEDEGEAEEETEAEAEEETTAEAEITTAEETDEETEERTTVEETAEKAAEVKETEKETQETEAGEGTSSPEEIRKETVAEFKEETAVAEEDEEKVKEGAEKQSQEMTGDETEKEIETEAAESGRESEPETIVKAEEETTVKAEGTSEEVAEAESESKAEEATEAKGSEQDTSGNGSQEITDEWEIPGKIYDTVTIQETINARAYCVALEDVRKIVEANQEVEVVNNVIPSASYTAETDDAEFTVSVPDGAFTEEVELRVTKIEDEEQLKALADQAEEALEQGKTVSGILAYDISFISLTSREEIEPTEAVSVSIRVKEPIISTQAEQTEEKEATGVSVVHLPDEGEAEVVAVTENVQETNFEFEAESFSKYVLIKTASVETISKCVYLSSKGKNLSETDPDIGLTPTNPVKTFEEAKSLLEDSGEGQKIIYIVGEVIVSEDESWELNDEGGMLKRYPSYAQRLIQVKKGITLSLSNITIDGGGEGITDPYGASPIIKNSGTLIIGEGTNLQNNYNRDTHYDEDGKGGAIYNLGTVKLNGGVIQNNIADAGGGIYTEGVVEINGNSRILSNKAVRSSWGRGFCGCGGGVYVARNALITMEDKPLIADNEADASGGGICIGDEISQEDIALKSGIIENNTAVTGGGIYIGGGRKVTLTNVAITENHAQYEGRNVNAGGGVWYCNTGRGRFYASSGGYISENIAAGRSDDVDAEGWFFPGWFYLSTRLSSGQRVDWYDDRKGNRYSKDENPVSNSPSWIEELNGEGFLHSEIYNGGIEAANIGEYNMIITGNIGNEGGGIACNGVLTIGENKDIAITVTKKWLGIDGTEMTESLPESIKVSLYRLEEGREPQLLDSGIELNADNEWSYTFFDLPCGYQYRVVEENAGTGYEVSYYVKEEGETNKEEKVEKDYAVGDGTKKNWQITITNQKVLKKGDLVISKKIFDPENNLSERNKKETFTFVIEFRDENQELLADGTKFNYEGGVIDNVEGIIPPDNGILEIHQGKAEVKLRHGQKITIKDILEGTQYTITEEKADGDGYSVMVNGEPVDNISGIITGAETEAAEAAFTNVVKTGGLIISKQVSGDHLTELDTDIEFTFKVELKDRDGSALTGQYPYKKSDSEGYITSGDTVTLKHGELIAIQGLPEGSQFTVWEVKTGNTDGYTASIREDDLIKEADIQEGMLVGGSGTIADGKGGAIHFINTVDTGSLSIQKTVTGLANENDDEFTFEVKLSRKDDQPLTGSYPYTRSTTVNGAAEPETGELTLDEEGRDTITLRHGQIITIPDLPIGTKYEVEEKAHDGYTANAPVNAKGTVQKKDINISVKFVNNADTGKLSIQKTVTGQAGDKTKGFTFTVALTDKDGKALTGTYPYTGSVTEEGADEPQSESLTLNANGEARITLKHGQRITVSGLPAGTAYKVTEVEANQDGYTTKGTGAEGTIEKDGEKTAAFVNDKPDVPEETTPEETTPTEPTTPEETTPTEPTTPEETTPTEPATPEETTPTEPTTPEETSPSEEPTAPEETTPQESPEEPTTPEETTPAEPTSPENPTTPSRPSGGGGGGGGRDRDRNPEVTPETTPIPPEEVPLANIDPEDVPLAMMPSESPTEAMVIDDEGVPLFGLPRTGDRSVQAGALLGMMLLSLMAACGIHVKKRKEEE